PMNPVSMKRKLSYVFSDKQSSVLTEIIHDAYSDLVHTGDFNELKEIVRNLGAAQERTELRVEELVVSQQELAAAQNRTEQRVGELATAQQKTESALQNLAKQVGGLSDRMGGDLEDTAYIVLYDVLEREFGWQVGELARSWHKWGRTAEEIDIFGKAQDPERPDVNIWILGEVKFNLTLKDVDKFTKQVERARQHLEGEVFPVCFCYRARPEVRRVVKQAGLRMIYSYGKMV
ncbi:MAG: hypothetical protein KKD28_06195, partial [Chloroflexi bacterium]|nr:hypothetical protein [Chloroflexota bacterium]